MPISSHRALTVSMTERLNRKVVLDLLTSNITRNVQTVHHLFSIEVQKCAVKMAEPSQAKPDIDLHRLPMLG